MRPRRLALRDIVLRATVDSINYTLTFHIERLDLCKTSRHDFCC